jgi:cytochrome c peroxidase
MNKIFFKQKTFFATVVLATILLLGSCQKESAFVSDTLPSGQGAGGLSFLTELNDPILPSTLYEYANIPLPAYLRTNQINAQNNAPANNPVTNAGATLGRVLFYDKNLSANNTISCASCHQQAFAFSDPEQFSTGFAGGKTGRNSMSLLDATYYQNRRFFWDERAASAEMQASMPMVHPVEMGMADVPAVVEKLKTIGYYPELYQNAFGSETIDSVRTVQAIAQFIRSMVSYRTKYDEGRFNFAANQNINNVNFPNFTAQENLGKQIFFGRGECNDCHSNETFTMPAARNNGLDVVSTDNGVGAVTGNNNQNALFKVPSLRGIAESAPYMHDGRFRTLAEVVEHYNSGVQAHPNLSPQMRGGGGGRRGGGGNIRRLNLSQAEKAALVAFMETLTDTGIANDPKFSDPFLANTSVK